MAGNKRKSTPAKASSSTTEVQEAGGTAQRCFIVGIGASAGGLDAFKKFFHAMPDDSGLSFVLVQHQAPHGGSLLAEILSQHTKMPVAPAVAAAPLRPNHVYIAPPGKYLALHDGVLMPVVPDNGLRAPIDSFFRSLAEVYQDRAIGIVFSGSGSEGTLGLKAIKEQGGLALVQAPETAQFDSMPRSALVTGLIDFALPVDKMPEVLVRYIKHPFICPPRKTTEQPSSVEESLGPLLDAVRAKTGRDFSNYKRATIVRRLERRMGLVHVDNVEQYLRLLKSSPTEADQLHKDLLISVTDFFRDPSAWSTLQAEFLRPLLKKLHPDDSLRVWVPGCATGEEAYTLGILLLEELGPAPVVWPHIFATDVNEDAVRFARAGIYPASIAGDVTPARLARFFDKTSDRYEVKKSLRDRIVFSVQNLVADPPFSHLDLISCRNLLIYLEPDLQQQVIDLFHFCLKREGLLLLGASETIGRSQGLFEPVSKPARIYRRTDSARRLPPDFPFRRAVTRGVQPPPVKGRLGEAPLPVAELARQILLKEFAPAAVVVNGHGVVQHFSGAISRFLEIPAGAPTLDVLALIPDEARAKVRGALRECAAKKSRLAVRGVRLRRNGHEIALDIEIFPVALGAVTEALYLLTFSEEPAPPAPAAEILPAHEDCVVRQLEAELQATRADLNASVKELESFNEELKISNEEILSTNEELQSSNEELETSKEELQSVNEELSTVNSQLQEKVHELEAATNDLNNLLAGTDIATVFLDPSLCVKRFNAASGIFKLIPSDVGRPLADIAPRFSDNQLLSDARDVLDNLMPRIKEVQNDEGRWFMRRIVPYRTQDNHIEGVVMTFTEITQLHDTLEELRVSSQQQAVVAKLGLRAVAARDLRLLLEEAAWAVSKALAVDLVAVLQYRPDKADFLLQAGVGWKPGQIDKVVEGSGPSAYFAFALKHGGPLAMEDSRQDKRFTMPELWAEHGVVGSLSVPIPSVNQPYGLLTAHSTSPRPFNAQDSHFLQTIANILGEIIGRVSREQALKELNETLEERIEDRSQTNRLLREIAVASNIANTVEEAVTFTLKRVCEVRGWRVGHYFQLSEKKSRLMLPSKCWHVTEPKEVERFMAVTMKTRLKPGEGLVGKGAAEGKSVYIRDLADPSVFTRAREAIAAGLHSALVVPVMIGKQAVGVLEFFAERDIEPDASLLAAMATIGTQLGRVVERQGLQKRLSEAMWEEQRRLGQQLHDTVGQELTGLGMMAKTLARKLKTQKLAEAAQAADLVEGLLGATGRVHDYAKGMFPGEILAADLPKILTDLAAETQRRHNVPCVFHADPKAVVRDDEAAFHLFLIAREAVTNAIKHAKAKGIEVSLRAERGATVLCVRDDGDGFAAAAPQLGDGLGLRIMRHRCSLLGGTLDVTSKPGGGTTLSCVLGGTEPAEG
jgi:two-component system, chemotaxis family, CheB/CheR fusion protein